MSFSVGSISPAANATASHKASAPESPSHAKHASGYSADKISFGGSHGTQGSTGLMQPPEMSHAGGGKSMSSVHHDGGMHAAHHAAVSHATAAPQISSVPSTGAGASIGA